MKAHLRSDHSLGTLTLCGNLSKHVECTFLPQDTTCTTCRLLVRFEGTSRQTYVGSADALAALIPKRELRPR